VALEVQQRRTVDGAYFLDLEWLDAEPSPLDEPVDVRFAMPKPEKPGSKAEVETLAFDGEDAPDPIVDGKIDLGALAVEFMALGLDPYPRKPGAEFTPPASDEALDSPFDALAKIAKKAD